MVYVNAALCGALWWTCFCRVVRTDSQTHTAVRLGFCVLAAVAAACGLAPFGLFGALCTAVPTVGQVVLTGAMVLVQALTARFWRDGVPSHFQRQRPAALMQATHVELSMQQWIEIARRYEGTREVKGPGHNPLIVKWLALLGAWWRDDETPWCGVFVGAVLREAGLAVPKDYFRASAWATWGTALAAPVDGCVVVFTRQGGGHVGFVVGQDAQHRLLVLGGNQGDAVSVAAFDRSRAVAYRWPTGRPMPQGLSSVAGAVPLSTSEA